MERLVMTQDLWKMNNSYVCDRSLIEISSNVTIIFNIYTSFPIGKCILKAEQALGYQSSEANFKEFTLLEEKKTLRCFVFVFL